MDTWAVLRLAIVNRAAVNTHLSDPSALQGGDWLVGVLLGPVEICCELHQEAPHQADLSTVDNGVQGQRWWHGRVEETRVRTWRGCACVQEQPRPPPTPTSIPS